MDRTDPPATPADPPLVAPGPGLVRQAWPYIKVLVALAAIGLAAWVVSGKTQELTGVGDYLGHLRWWWMVLAVAAELLSYAALSSLQRRLLRAGKVRVPAHIMMGITLAGAAIQYSFPGGGVLYLAYLFRQFRRWGADELLAGWVVVAFNLVTFIALALISAAGLALAFGTGSTYDLVEVIVGTVGVAALLTIVIVERRRLIPQLTRMVGLSQRFLHWPDGGRPATEIVHGWTTELSAVSPSRGVWARSLVMALASWLADLSCLIMSFLAVGVGVPWRGLLLAYGAGQLASILPITPGGLGAVEGSLTVALVTFGGGAESTVAAVLLYRLVSFWMMLPIGWVSWAALALTGRRAPSAPGPGSRAVPALESGRLGLMHSFPGRRASAAALLLVALVVAPACSHTPGVSNGSVSVCYRAIPVGKATVHERAAKLIGVHRVPVDSVRDHLPPALQAQLAAEDDTSVCVMAFHGTFTAAQVDMAAPGTQGPYALVLVSSKQLHLIGAVLLDHLPSAFGGRTV